MKTIQEFKLDPSTTPRIPKELLRGLYDYKEYVKQRAAVNKDPMWVKHSNAVNQFVKMVYGFYLVDHYDKKYE